MSVEAFLDELSDEARAAMRVLLRKAYETGFREALAGTGQVPTAVDPAVGQVRVDQPAPHASAGPPAPDPAPVAWAGRAGENAGDPPEEADEGGGGDDGGDGDDGDDDVEEAPAPRPILANAKVGTLRRRIVQTFDLERFEIEVVICREGDPERRQLRSSARLGSYRREEE